MRDTFTDHKPYLLILRDSRDRVHSVDVLVSPGDHKKIQAGDSLVLQEHVSHNQLVTSWKFLGDQK